MKTPRTVLVALVAAAALTACAAPGADPASPATTGATPMTSAPEPSASPSAPLDPTPPKGGPSKPAGPSTTLTGTVQAGVEPNCFLLDGNLLVGAPRGALKAGARVTVTGHSQPGLMTTCQQGTPFVVESVRPA
ncbi:MULTISPECIES: hypothetical protein [Micromonospora]|uniref:Uncharacterized protein n=1 Tax=Micromonospora solifontis TaxID=2487138 RepID=A0ABX9WLF8_9ACTN|nr:MULTISPECIES: hypothetical protein [Micromonospora]NES14320.1 hypothetical protein [Micromonospora sp. PPF5-17B]NES35072.1 hypothetical protein [Micromonospora solifontis]NES57747.1 hypothetical protein [Micromonospora sp. PPF5-6]RNM01342.1 hypothetical protein EFE23_02650 [Micromonospora solifontis]